MAVHAYKPMQLRKKDQEFVVILDYMVSSRSTGIGESLSKKKKGRVVKVVFTPYCKRKDHTLRPPSWA